MDFNRREFLQSAAVGAVVAPSLGAGALAGSKPPMRDFGKTGIKVSALGFGSGSRFLMSKREDRALESLSLALDLGAACIDRDRAQGGARRVLSRA